MTFILADVCNPADAAVGVDLMLSILNSCCNDAKFDISAFFVNHDIVSGEVTLTREDVVSHVLNGQCASRKAPGCSEVMHAVQSPVRIALTITETIITCCERKQILA